MTNKSYRESVINENLITESEVSKLFFGVDLRVASGHQATLWRELLNPPPTHQVIIGYIVKTGKLERRIIDIKVSFNLLGKSDKEVSGEVGRYLAQILRSANDRWALFRSGKNTEWYLTQLVAKYRSMRGASP